VVDSRFVTVVVVDLIWGGFLWYAAFEVCTMCPTERTLNCVGRSVHPFQALEELGGGGKKMHLVFDSEVLRPMCISNPNCAK
jgi:hypothetical protein